MGFSTPRCSKRNESFHGPDAIPRIPVLRFAQCWMVDEARRLDETNQFSWRSLLSKRLDPKQTLAHSKIFRPPNLQLHSVFRARLAEEPSHDGELELERTSLSGPNARACRVLLGRFHAPFQAGYPSHAPAFQILVLAHQLREDLMSRSYFNMFLAPGAWNITAN